MSTLVLIAIGVGTRKRMVTFSSFNGRFRVEAVGVDGKTYRSKPMKGNRKHAEDYVRDMETIDLSKDEWSRKGEAS
jgi:hypothetical protein